MGRLRAVVALTLACVAVGAAASCSAFGTDASSASDAAPPADAGNAGDASLLGVRCADRPNALWCADFDDPARPSTPPFGWDDTDQVGGSLQLADDAATSSPHSLRSTVTPGSASGAVNVARFWPDLQATTGQLEFDYRVETFGTGQSYAAYVAFANSATKTDYTVQVRVDGNQTIVLAEDLQGSFPEASGEKVCGNVAPQRWYHLRLWFDLKPDAGPPTEYLSIDGAPPCTRPLTQSAALTAPYSTTLRVGAVWEDAKPGTWTLHHDSVVFDAR